MKAITIYDNESFLRQVSKKVDISDVEELKKDIAILDDFCKKNQVMAMASVQLGIPKRLIYLKNTNLDIINKMQSNSETEEERQFNESKILINPVIIKKEGLTEYWEACASCLDNCGRVLRPYKITLEYYDINGNKCVEIFEGFKATVLSHEYDHLDGILHIDIAEEVIEMPVEERKKWRQTHGYIIFSQLGQYEQLKKEKQGLIKKLI